MEWAALFKVIQSWGPSAISSALVIVVVYLIRQLHKNSEDDAKRAGELKSMVDTKLNELRAGTAKVLDEHGRRLSCIELEYVKRESFYRELGGWKDDINRLSGQIADVSRNIIELWKDKRGQ